MRCPVCGKEVHPATSNCIHCGASLIGPRSIDLDLPEHQKQRYNNSNLQKITGININEINRDDDTSYKKEKSTKKKKRKSGNIVSTILTLLSIALFVASILIFFFNKDDIKCPKCNKEEKTNIINKGFSGIYTFETPSDYIYTLGENDTLISNTKINIVLFNPVNYQYGNINKEALLKQYHETGYQDAVITEDSLNNKKIIFISFSASDYHFTDFYYEYNNGTTIYGQISSTEANIIDDQVKNIIKSLEIKDNQNISVSRATFDYNKVFAE